MEGLILELTFDGSALVQARLHPHLSRFQQCAAQCHILAQCVEISVDQVDQSGQIPAYSLASAHWRDQQQMSHDIVDCAPPFAECQRRESLPLPVKQPVLLDDRRQHQQGRELRPTERLRQRIDIVIVAHPVHAQTGESVQGRA